MPEVNLAVTDRLVTPLSENPVLTVNQVSLVPLADLVLQVKTVSQADEVQRVRLLLATLVSQVFQADKVKRVIPVLLVDLVHQALT